MSLINEALKKAQNQHGAPGAPPPNEPPVTPNVGHMQQPDKSTKRSFVWGFIAAVLIIALVSTLLATFFVWQILGPSDTEQTKEPALVEEAPLEPVNPEPASPAVAETTAIPTETPAPVKPSGPIAASPPPVVETVPDPVVEEPVPVPPAPVAAPVAQTPPAPEPAVVSEEAAAPPSASTPATGPKPPDSEVIARLQELQIRGIMSGGVKVLIHDGASGRTRAYRVGESLEGPMGLVVSGISSSTIQFKDYAGSTHTKSF